MGRKKLENMLISDEKSREITFCKRCGGLFKKGNELSVLTGCRVFIMIKKEVKKKGVKKIIFCSDNNVNYFFIRETNQLQT